MQFITSYPRRDDRETAVGRAVDAMSACQSEHLGHGGLYAFHRPAVGTVVGSDDGIAKSLPELSFGWLVVSGKVEAQVGLLFQQRLHLVYEEMKGAAAGGLQIVGAADMDADRMVAELVHITCNGTLNGFHGVEELCVECVRELSEVLVATHVAALATGPGLEVEALLLKGGYLPFVDTLVEADALVELGNEQVALARPVVKQGRRRIALNQVKKW